MPRPRRSQSTMSGRARGFSGVHSRWTLRAAIVGAGHLRTSSPTTCGSTHLGTTTCGARCWCPRSSLPSSSSFCSSSCVGRTCGWLTGWLPSIAKQAPKKKRFCASVRSLDLAGAWSVSPSPRCSPSVSAPALHRSGAIGCCLPTASTSARTTHSSATTSVSTSSACRS